MTHDEFDPLALAYLHGELQSRDAARLQQHLDSEPALLARLLELADEELLLRDGLRKMPVSTRVSHRSKRLSQRRVRQKPSVQPFAIGLGIAAIMALALLAFHPWEKAASSSVATLAVLTGASPDATLIHDGQTIRAKSGLALSNQDQLSTREGVATLAYADGTIVQLSANSALKLDGTSSGKQIRLLSGTLHCSAAKQAPATPFVLQTREASSTVLGTTFKLMAVSGSTTLQVDEGSVKFTDLATHESAQVGAGEFAVADNTSKLTVTKVNAPAVAELADTFSQEFPTAESIGQGVLDLKDAPPGGVSSVKEVPIPNSDKLWIMGSKFLDGRPYFVVRDDSVIHIQYRADSTGGFSEFEFFLCLFPAEGWSSEQNVICRVKPRSTNWESADLPIASFLPVNGPSKKVEGMVCRAFFIQNYDFSGIHVAKVWVTRSTKQ